MKKTALLLVIAMLAVFAAGCAESKEKDTSAGNDTTAAVTDAETEELDSLEARKLVSDDLPEYDAEGYEFLYVLSDSDEFFIMEEATGDVVDDAVYARNVSVSERFNVEFATAILSDYNSISAYIRKCLNAGDDAYDLISEHVVGLGAHVLEDSFVNWYDIEYINFSKPWWAESTSEDLTFNGRAYIAVGDLALSSITQTYCVFYNKKLGADYNIPDMFEIINSGKWTIDKQIELTKDIYEDLNNNSKKDYEDFYGFVSDASSNINTYLWAFENPIVSQNEAGELEFVMKTERLNEIVTKLVDMFENDAGCFTEKDNNHMGIGVDAFYKGRTIFGNGTIGNACSTLRELEDDYSILPYPKWNEAQKDYHTMSDGGHHALAVSRCETDIDRVGLITEALCAESYKQVIPAYYDVALKVKGTRDEESVAVLDMLVNSRVFDLGYVYDGWSGASFWLQNMIQNRSTDFESFYAKNSTKVIKHYEELIEYFMNDEG